jgi:hypothetical protein
MVDGMIKSYKRIPHPIKAIQYDGTAESRALVHAFVAGGKGTLTTLTDDNGETGVYIDDGDSVIYIAIDDFVIRDALEMYFSMNPEIFEATYEEL